jgi:hypothetical protein
VHRGMGDTWEDEADDWEAEADNMVAGINLNEVDESKFAGEDDCAPESWDDDVPASQVRTSGM